ncbi:UDP-glucose 4-epimerase GalE [Bacillus clarus]|uniref:UDP-glucose 4-epimerase n=1 Tax=Bacillus clarus TaxID=2338372 RepID=A0A090YV32_9BACI|nr:UDP-glucose 4-epimerase GalE [Bacillus clarus]KFN02082.1 UDP-glucose 4-epimerase GalE [Bacillus clarus]RFT64806.1 UDP-glucose 4-epimerase GalE [Bacillus clarus]
MAILVTGGAGYIGSHTCVELLNSGYDIVVVDDLSNSAVESLNRVREITGKQFEFYKENLLNREAINLIFEENTIEAVIHFAGFKAVGESVAIPLTYYYNNITSTLVLCEVMQKHSVKKMIFSSSATVYGIPEKSPIMEEFPLNATNPYGQTKLMIEQIMNDIAVADSEWSITLLRYFNPFGAHESGRIGEDPNGIPNNLMPYVTQVAVGKLKELSVFGNDYSTKDGTGIRDYIHVVDLANGHVKALEKILHTAGVHTYNLGTGTGYSVLEMVEAFEKASGKTVPYKIIDRRPGDVAVCFADVSKAKQELGWEAKRGLEEMCADSWKWQSNNKNGYQEAVLIR